MRVSPPFDPIEVAEVDTFVFDFTNEMDGAAAIVSTSWTCSLLPSGVATDPDPQSRVIAFSIETSLPVTQPNGTIVNTPGFFSAALVGEMPLTAAGGNYLLEATANLSPVPPNLTGRVIKLNGTVRCVDPTAPVIGIDASQFRYDFPEFSSTTLYSDPAIWGWLSVAGLMLNPRRWPRTPGADGRSLLDYGIELFVAHNLVLEVQAQQRAKLGGPPGVQIGVYTGGSANNASISYDPTIGINPEDGQWNLSIYGLRLIQLIKIVGSGPTQIGVGRIPFGSGPAWPGPWAYNPAWFW